MQVYKSFYTFVNYKTHTVSNIKNTQFMKATEQTLQQITRTIGKVADKFPSEAEPVILTDIHLRANQETGELVAFDDDDKEITRSVIE